MVNQQMLRRLLSVSLKVPLFVVYLAAEVPLFAFFLAWCPAGAWSACR